jgi:PIN domain nuclease of toxin-antitoxin system
VILLDTHAILWLVLKPDRLSKPATRAIVRAERSDGVAVASITLWEIAQLVDVGRVRIHGSTEGFLESLCRRPGVQVLGITPEIAALAFRFPPDFTQDPADRLIGATARVHGLRLVTRDGPMHDCPLLDTVW